MQYYETDILIVGSGIAGIVVALSIDPKANVIILTKRDKQNSNSYRAQGGIAAAIGDHDSPELHYSDTLKTGGEICNRESVKKLVNTAPEAITQLSKWGVVFDKEGRNWSLGLEGAHSMPRILHADGDTTGASIMKKLLDCLKKRPNISLIKNMFVLDLIVKDGICQGVLAIDKKSKTTSYRARKGVVLATGGCGQVYRYTTNSEVSTGDGFALAYKNNIRMVDMEFIQFHPTALIGTKNPMVLVSEAVRGEGAILIDEYNDRLLINHDCKDLAPRDIVARTIYNAQQNGRQIYLDARSIHKRFIQRFPYIYFMCKKIGIDPRNTLIPITPAAHFIMGGIEVTLDGKSSMPNLYACGEVACNGVHGANRLASNSLLEGVVFAQQVAESICNSKSIHKWGKIAKTKILPLPHKTHITKFHHDLGCLMWENAGITRTGDNLKKALQKLIDLKEKMPKGCFTCDNLWITAKLITSAAYKRKESRGSHYRQDYPHNSQEWSKKHNAVVHNKQ